MKITLNHHPLFTVAVLLALALGSAVTSAEEADTPVDLSGKRVAMLVCEGVHDAEALVPLGFLTNRGARVTVIGVAPGYAKAYNSDIQIRIEKLVTDVDAADFDAVVIPGGKSPACLREHETVLAFVKTMVEAGKPAAAICHGPQVLLTAGLVEGKRVTAYSKVADELREAGAVYEDAPMVRDGNIITSRIPDDLPAFCRAIETALAGESR